MERLDGIIVEGLQELLTLAMRRWEALRSLRGWKSNSLQPSRSLLYYGCLGFKMYLRSPFSFSRCSRDLPPREAPDAAGLHEAAGDSRGRGGLGHASARSPGGRFWAVLGDADTYVHAPHMYICELEVGMYLSVCKYKYVHTCKHMRMYTYMNTITHTHICAPLCVDIGATTSLCAGVHAYFFVVFNKGEVQDQPRNLRCCPGRRC